MTNTPPSSNDENPVIPDGQTGPVPPVEHDPAPETASPAEPAPLAEPTPVAEPAPPVETHAADAAEPVALVEPTSPIEPSAPDGAAPPVDSLAEAAGYEEHIEEPRAVEPEPATAAPTTAVPATPVVQTVYVTPPTPPKRKGNRGYGILFAFLGLIVFALLFVGVMALVLNAMFPGEMLDRAVGFVSSTAFIVPLAVFFVAFVLLVLITNRATWWAYVLGSFVVAVVVYFGSIGVVLLMANVFGMTPDAAAAGFVSLATSPSIIVAAVVAREVTIWFGAAIASRGRKITARNLDARAEYERELDNQPLGFS